MKKMFYLWGLGGDVAYEYSLIREDMIVLSLFGCLYFMSLVYGCIHNVGMEFLLEINMFSSPYHHLGISFFGEDISDEYSRETLILGLVFINIIFAFYKRR